MGSVVGALIGAVVTAFGFYFAWREIRNAGERHEDEMVWKRSEFVRGLLVEMHTDPNIVLICRVLDWREGPAIIPPQFRDLFDKDTKRRLFRKADSATFVEIDWDRFVMSLATDHRTIDWRSPDLYMYRTCFDSYCSFIQRIADDLRASKIGASQFADLAYFCHRTIWPQNQHKVLDPKAKAVIADYILHYNGSATYNVIKAQADRLEKSEAPIVVRELSVVQRTLSKLAISRSAAQSKPSA